MKAFVAEPTRVGGEAHENRQRQGRDLGVVLRLRGIHRRRGGLQSPSRHVHIVQPPARTAVIVDTLSYCKFSW